MIDDGINVAFKGIANEYKTCQCIIFFALNTTEAKITICENFFLTRFYDTRADRRVVPLMYLQLTRFLCPKILLKTYDRSTVSL